MAKRMGLVGVFAIGLLVFLIWNDPQSAANTVGDFLGWLGDIIGEAWQKIGDFIGNLSD